MLNSGKSILPHSTQKHSDLFSWQSLRRSCFLLVLLLITFLSPLKAQEISTEDLQNYKKQCVDLVSFLEFTLNLVGNPETSTRDKDIIINQSYLKMFRDSAVQVEDDLEESRRVATNKDVQAYLKDVDFFFESVVFDMTVEDVSHHLNEDGQIYFLITLTRNLQAVNVKGDTLNINQPRFIEVNLDQEEKDLKIASIYTTKLSEEEELSNWWNELPYEWKLFFGDRVSVSDNLTMLDVLRTNGRANVGDTVVVEAKSDILVINDSVTVLDMLALSDTLDLGDTVFLGEADTIVLSHPIIYSHIRQLVEAKSLDLSYQNQIFDLSPLSKLTQLKELNIEGTGVSSLLPLRNLTKLEVLRCGKTDISSLAPLKYAFDLKELYCQQTPIRSLSPAQNFSKLEKLYCFETRIDSLDLLQNLTRLREILCFRTNISDLSPLANLKQLNLLNCSNTLVNSLVPLGNLTNLEVLDIEGNFVANLAPLSGTRSLRLLFADSTKIRDLAPLSRLPNISKIYCDNTSIDQRQANQFMRNRSGVLVIYESAQLADWWNQLVPDWKKVFGMYVQLGLNPTREQLHEVANIEKVDIFGHPSITTLEPLSMLINLKELKCSQTKIGDLQPLSDLVGLEKLECINTSVNNLAPLSKLSGLRELQLSETQVSDVSPLASVSSLEILNIDKTPVSDISALAGLENLKVVYGDGTQINNVQVKGISKINSDVLIIYQTPVLEVWWSQLPDSWKLIFRSQVQTSEVPTREQLHSMLGISVLNIPESSNITSLEALEGCYRLKELRFNDTPISSLMPLLNLSSLESLHCAKNPISDLAPLAALPNLKVLNIENTPVSDLTPLANLRKLEDLRCGGTQIKKLNPLAALNALKRLDCYNTDVRSLKPLEGLPNLLRLTCYNTKLNVKKVANFKKTHSNTEVVFY